MTMQTLPLDTLILSKLNVRTTERDADIEALADDIAARGLKQNLVVIPAHFMTGEAESGWDNKWEVIAGGRRFQAMQLLVADGRLPADHPVACLLEERDDASETSLSENLHKVAMNPADEFAAFKAIVDQRMSPKHGESENDAIAYTAKRFGATVSHVQGRLRLADAAPEILDALRNNVIGVEAAKAYATTTDHDLQLKVFKERSKDTWNGHKPATIRDAIRNRTLPIDHPLAQFVGLVTYQAEGGRIEAEMFMGAEGQQRIVDVALLEKLAKKIAEAAIPALVKLHGLKEGLYATGQGIGYYAKWPKSPAGYVKNWGDVEGLSKAKRKQLIGIYALDKDSDEELHKLKLIGTLKPEEQQVTRDDRDWEAERREAARERAIFGTAARLVVPATAGTPFEGRAFWPEYNPVRECDEENTYVVMLIKVPNADIESNRAEATRLIDEEAAAEAERAEAARIAQLAQDHPDYVKPIADDDDQDDGADELTTDEVDG